MRTPIKLTLERLTKPNGVRLEVHHRRGCVTVYLWAWPTNRRRFLKRVVSEPPLWWHLAATPIEVFVYRYPNSLWATGNGQ